VRADNSRAHLLVVADDFGLHTDIDRGILECVERGRVQGVSFCPTGRSLEWKRLIELMDQGVHVGLHLTLVGEPWSTDGRVIPAWQHLVKHLILGDSHSGRRWMQKSAGNSSSAPTMASTPRDSPIWTVTSTCTFFSGLWKLCLAQAKAHGIRRIRVPWCPTLRIIRRSVGESHCKVLRDSSSASGRVSSLPWPGSHRPQHFCYALRGTAIPRPLRGARI